MCKSQSIPLAIHKKQHATITRYVAFFVVGVLFVVCFSVQIATYYVFHNSILRESRAAEHSVHSVMTTTTRTSATGGLHACVRFSTKYEARHIVSWLHYHSRLGISHFHLYFDANHSNLDKLLERKAYDLIQSFSYTTIYNMEEIGFSNEYHVLHHCFTSSHLLLKAEWVMEFDIDEVFAFYERSGKNDNPPMCNDHDDNDKYGIASGALATFIANVPQYISAVMVPRIDFRTNGIVFEPETFNQMELYVHRVLAVSSVGKVMVRTNTDVANNIDNKHSIWSPQDSVIYPCGRTVSPTKCDDSKGYCHYEFNRSHIAQETHLSASPFLYHYITRSQQECKLKLRDLPSDNWRVLNSATVCAHTIKHHDMVYDYGLYCIGKAISHELRVLYPSYDRSPFIF